MEQVREQLSGEAAHRAIAECFVSDWELRHERSAHANLVLRYSTRGGVVWIRNFASDRSASMLPVGIASTSADALLITSSSEDLSGTASVEFLLCAFLTNGRAIRSSSLQPRSAQRVSWQ